MTQLLQSLRYHILTTIKDPRHTLKTVEKNGGRVIAGGCNYSGARKNFQTPTMIPETSLKGASALENLPESFRRLRRRW